MTTTAVPEPSTIILLLFIAWIVACILLLRNPKLRAAGILVAVVPLVLAVVAVAFDWYFSPFSLVDAPTAWRSHHVTRNGIDLDMDYGTRGKVTIPPAPSTERHESIVWNDSGAAAEVPHAVGVRWIVFLLLAMLIFGGLAAAVAMLAFPKTRLVGILLLSVGAVVIVVGFLAWIPLSLEPVRVARGPVRIQANQHDIQVESNIPVESGEKVEVKSTKPVAKPPAEKAKTPSRAPVKAAIAVEKKPDAAKTAEAPAAPLPPAKKRPAWVDEPAHILGDTYQMTIVVGPYATPQECDDELPGELHKALNRYIETYVGRPAAAQPVTLPYDFLRDEVVKSKWEEVAPSSVGPMTRLYVLLQFDRKVKSRIIDECQRSVVAGRLWMAGSGLAVVLWLLAVMYGYLRIDLKTGGAYRGRLRFAAVLAILGPVAATLLAVV
jgi:hypothetical protein